MLDGFLHDVRFSTRLIAKHPLLSAATILILTLGIGLDAGFFTLIDGVLLRPRVAHDPATFVEVRTRPLMSLDEYQAYRDARSLRALAAWAPVHASIDGSPVLPLLVTCNFFAVYAPARPLLGHVFGDADCASADAGRLAIIGEQVWRTRFAADPGVIGRVLTLNARDFTIVGVMPANYDGELRGPVWVPYTMATAFFGGRDLFREPATPWLLGFTGRLAAGATRPSLRAELQVIAARRSAPDTPPRVDVTDGSMIDAPGIRPMAAWIVPTVLGALTVVLVMACLNVAILMLSRAHARQTEIAIRMSIGATRSRLVWMLLVDSVMLAALATVPSAWLAGHIPGFVHALIPTMPYYPFDVDHTVLFYIAGIALVAGIVAGVVPAMESLNANRWRSTKGLLATQIAMSLVLLVVAALFVRTEQRMANTSPGYETDHLIVVVPRIDLPPYTASTAATFYETLSDRLRSAASVRGVATADAFDGDEGAAAPAVAVVADATTRMTSADVHRVSASFFDTLGLSIVRGDGVRDSTAAGRVMPVVVSESLAHALWPDRDPVGERLHDDTTAMEVAGITRDVRSMLGRNAQVIYQTKTVGHARDAVLVRVAGDPRDAMARVRTMIASLDPDAVTEPRTASWMRQDLAARFMRVVDLVIALAVVAFVLAIVGIYGAVAFWVSRRMKEIGIRVALGATSADVTQLVLQTGLKPIGVGIGFGLVAAATAAIAIARVFRGTPVHPDAFDPIPYASVSALILITAIMAMLGPCRRATSSDPVQALRRE